MRMSNRDKQNRKARINREKEQKQFEKKEFKSKFNRKNIQNRFTTNKPNRDYKQVNQDDFDNEQKSYEDIVAGRNAVMELLKSGKDINKIFVENGEKHGSINEIIARAKENRIVLIEVDKSKLDQMAENHQGVVAQVPPFDYCEVEDILDLAKERGEDPFIIVLEGIEDPHNLGAIIRTAETAGVHGIIIPKRRSVAVNATVSKVSAGATSYMKIARVNNINETIKKLKDNGLWVIGTDGAADTLYYNQDLKGPLAIIIGSEGFGMSKLVRENSDILIKIPMKGKVTSLNASVSAGIVIYEALRQRN